MNFAILGFYFLLAFAAFAQSNEPVIIVKPYRATNPQSIVKLFDGKLSPHEIQGEVLAVYDNYLKLRLNDQNGSENNGKTILLKKFEDETSAIGRVVVLWACCIGTIQAVNDDGTPKLGAVYELWESYDHRAASAAAQRESDRINAEIKKKEQAQLAEQRAQKAAQKADALARVLKLNQDAANMGDSFGLMRMGERYRDGEGVEKDLTKAREYFQKSFAADTNNFLAKEALSKLDAK